jgi:hypothetical protein
MKLFATPRATAPAALTLLLALPAAHADVLVDNLSQPYRGTSIHANSLWGAQSFITAADAVRLDSIEIPIGLAEGAPNIVAEVHADAGAAQVGAVLASLLLPPVSAGEPQVELLPAMPTLDLAPHTTYWVVLGVAGAGSVGWSYIEGSASSGPGTLGNFSYSTDGGGSWLNYGSDNPFYMRVNVSPVPEPGAAVLSIAGLLVIASRYRRRKSHALDAGS